MNWFKRMNIPNRLTTLRMVCVVLLLIVAFFPYNALALEIPTWTLFGKPFSLIRLILLVLFAFGSFTDFLDGHLARKHNLVTTFGKFMDPIADKLLVNLTFLVLASWGEFSMIVPIIFVARDTIVDAIRLIAVQRQIVIAASPLGKAKTVTQMVSLVLLLLHVPYAVILIYLAAVVSLLSGIDYFWKNRHIVLEGAFQDA